MTTLQEDAEAFEMAWGSLSSKGTTGEEQVHEVNAQNDARGAATDGRALADYLTTAQG
jgi:hypothetical protein